MFQVLVACLLLAECLGTGSDETVVGGLASSWSDMVDRYQRGSNALLFPADLVLVMQRHSENDVLRALDKPDDPPPSPQPVGEEVLEFLEKELVDHGTDKQPADADAWARDLPRAKRDAPAPAKDQDETETEPRAFLDEAEYPRVPMDMMFGDVNLSGVKETEASAVIDSIAHGHLQVDTPPPFVHQPNTEMLDNSVSTTTPGWVVKNSPNHTIEIVKMVPVNSTHQFSEDRSTPSSIDLLKFFTKSEGEELPQSLGVEDSENIFPGKTRIYLPHGFYLNKNDDHLDSNSEVPNVPHFQQKDEHERLRGELLNKDTANAEKIRGALLHEKKSQQDTYTAKKHEESKTNIEHNLDVPLFEQDDLLRVKILQHAEDGRKKKNIDKHIEKIPSHTIFHAGEKLTSDEKNKYLHKTESNDEPVPVLPPLQEEPLKAVEEDPISLKLPFPVGNLVDVNDLLKINVTFDEEHASSTPHAESSTPDVVTSRVPMQKPSPPGPREEEHQRQVTVPVITNTNTAEKNHKFREGVSLPDGQAPEENKPTGVRSRFPAIKQETVVLRTISEATELHEPREEYPIHSTTDRRIILEEPGKLLWPSEDSNGELLNRQSVVRSAEHSRDSRRPPGAPKIDLIENSQQTSLDFNQQHSPDNSFSDFNQNSNLGQQTLNQERTQEEASSDFKQNLTFGQQNQPPQLVSPHDQQFVADAEITDSFLNHDIALETNVETSERSSLDKSSSSQPAIDALIDTPTEESTGVPTTPSAAPAESLEAPDSAEGQQHFKKNNNSKRKKTKSGDQVNGKHSTFSNNSVSKSYKTKVESQKFESSTLNKPENIVKSCDFNAGFEDDGTFSAATTELYAFSNDDLQFQIEESSTTSSPHKKKKKKKKKGLKLPFIVSTTTKAPWPRSLADLAPFIPFPDLTPVDSQALKPTKMHRRPAVKPAFPPPIPLSRWASNGLLPGHEPDVPTLPPFPHMESMERRFGLPSFEPSYYAEQPADYHHSVHPMYHSPLYAAQSSYQYPMYQMNQDQQQSTYQATDNHQPMYQTSSNQQPMYQHSTNYHQPMYHANYQPMYQAPANQQSNYQATGESMYQAGSPQSMQQASGNQQSMSQAPTSQEYTYQGQMNQQPIYPMYPDMMNQASWGSRRRRQATGSESVDPQLPVTGKDISDERQEERQQAVQPPSLSSETGPETLPERVVSEDVATRPEQEVNREVATLPEKAEFKHITPAEIQDETGPQLKTAESEYAVQSKESPNAADTENVKKKPDQLQIASEPHVDSVLNEDTEEKVSPTASVEAGTLQLQLPLSPLMSPGIDADQDVLQLARAPRHDGVSQNQGSQSQGTDQQHPQVPESSQLPAYDDGAPSPFGPLGRRYRPPPPALPPALEDLIPKTGESEADKAEREQKAVQRMIQVVNVLGSLQNFLSDRARTLVRRLSKIVDEEEDPNKLT